MRTLVRYEMMRLHSQCPRTGMLLYPGVWELTWVKLPHMPWTLLGMQQAGP